MTKYIKLFEELTDGYHREIKAYHSSDKEITEFSPTGAWFTPREDWSRAYHEVSSIGGQGYLYEVMIRGIILDEEDAKRLALGLGLNWDEILDTLCSNPTIKERMEIAKEFRGIDGFYHWDYDPLDFQEDGLSIFVFNPKSSVKIIKRLT